MDKELGFVSIKVEEDFQIELESNLQTSDIVLLLKTVTTELEQEQEEEAKEE